jgi:hypothetical protein
MDVRSKMTIEIDQLQRRIEKIEKLKNEEALTLVEILANITFFGDLKKTQCEHAKNGQCNFFVLSKEAKGKIPISTDCRIKLCEEVVPHCHLELSNISCALCDIGKEQQKLSKSKPIKRNEIFNLKKTPRKMK